MMHSQVMNRRRQTVKRTFRSAKEKVVVLESWQPNPVYDNEDANRGSVSSWSLLFECAESQFEFSDSHA